MKLRTADISDRAKSFFGSKGVVYLPLANVPGAPPYVLYGTSWVAIETGREPICSGRDGGWTIEMVAGIYESGFAGSRIAFPVTKRSATTWP